MLRSFTKVNGQSHTYLDDTPLAPSGGTDNPRGQQPGPRRVRTIRSSTKRSMHDPHRYHMSSLTPGVTAHQRPPTTPSQIR